MHLAEGETRAIGLLEMPIAGSSVLDTTRIEHPRLVLTPRRKEI
jgi:hypothetical protein